ncbi:MAG: hypothetical protein K0Q99_1775, partial [Clostridia bacterium]|nr:hypothetical protein [Clostridia bacterium]
MISLAFLFLLALLKNCVDVSNIHAVILKERRLKDLKILHYAQNDMLY